MWKWGKIELDVSFPAMLVLAWVAGAGAVLPVIGGAALCHELGHFTALYAAGAKIERIRLTAFGAEILADTRFLPYGREILCTLAGPATNLLLAVLLAQWAGAYLAAGANLLLGCFNLLPVSSLDGGRALYLAVSWAFGPLTADVVSRWIGLTTSFALTIGAAWMVLRHQAGLFFLFGALGTLLPQLFPARST